ncbi:MAG: substrate-binding domain-containing protein [Azospirillum sp.]|nr:substrate-binding domain-containing protein [Azospirillum sp.]
MNCRTGSRVERVGTRGAHLALAAVTVLLLLGSATEALAGTIPQIGCSWGGGDEPRWKIDEAAVLAVMEAAKAACLSVRAQNQAAKQAEDIKSMVGMGVSALIVMPVNARNLLPTIAEALARKIPVVAYDRPIELQGTFYVSFDNRQVGRLQAAKLLETKPNGIYVFIEGDDSDLNVSTVHLGHMDILQAPIAKGAITIASDSFTKDWSPETAKANMVEILRKNHNHIDAVLAGNDRLAGAAIEVLAEVGEKNVAVVGQDGDFEALNRIAQGTQTATVIKDYRMLGTVAAEVALALGQGRTPTSLPDTVKWRRDPAGPYFDARLLAPQLITRRNLGDVIQAGLASREDVCRDVSRGVSPPACW